MRDLYPEISPYNHFKLEVTKKHTIYIEEVGNPSGTPVIFLHGGPGGGCGTDYRRYFNPNKWRIILFDQRGCGRSTPFAELEDNTTWDLVNDIEKIRNYLNVSKWYIFGGSWGSTLSLSYGISHPEKCLGFILRGIFLLRRKEIQWFYQEGASRLYPEAWEKYLKPIPNAERNDLISAYYKILTGDDEQAKTEAARAWSVWEASTSKLIQSEDLMESFDEDKFAQAFARIECHYFKNNGFFETDNWLLDNAHRISHLPTWIVHGRYDVVCPVESAWDLKKQIPNADLSIMQQSGHSLSEPEIKDKIIEITDSIVG